MGFSCIVDYIMGKMSHHTFNCSKLSNCYKSGPCVHIQYDISDSELALELSSELLTPTLTVWQTLHTEGIHPYHIQCIQHLEPVDMCK